MTELKINNVSSKPYLDCFLYFFRLNWAYVIHYLSCFVYILIKSKHMLIQQNFDLKGEIIIFNFILMVNLLCNFYFVRHIYKIFLYPDCENLSWGENEFISHFNDYFYLINSSTKRSSSSR